TQGTIRRVRFIEGVLRPAGTPRSSSANGVLPVPRRLIGEAPVEEDGSFNVEVPAQTPILVQTLDQYGLALGTSDWIWVQPKETRGCIGCHEDPELTPENEYVKALRRPSNKLVLPPDKRRSIVFREEVAPIVQARCASSECHGNSSNPLFLPLSAGRSAASDLEQAYRALTAPESDGSTKSDTPGQSHGKYIDPGSARTSWIAWQLLGTNTTRPWDLSPQKDTRPQKKISKMPPPGKGSPLSPEELYTILQWIDLGAAFTMPDELPTKK
ncbi:MAG: hypothetical protein N3G20_02095, partial [Verrucomicrobiae bacterium]|nr:hypothetical protein [Verrucomicrobiae bacterium]